MNITKNLSKYNKTKLTDFYNSNNINKINYAKYDHASLLLCTYNVHGWININNDINVNDNFINILNMISVCKDIDILVLEEVCFRTELSKKYIKEQFQKIGFQDSFYVPNGGCFLNKSETDFIMIFGKNKFQSKKMMDVTNFIFKRYSAIFHYNNLKFIAVHLEIGKRYHHLSGGTVKTKIMNENINRRIQQLDKLLKSNDTDIIIGDYNFSPNDNEYNWLTNKNYVFCEDFIHTTPYNRTDMIFINNNNNNNNNNKIKNIKNETVKCNYSDHLLVLCEIKKVEK